MKPEKKIKCCKECGSKEGKISKGLCLDCKEKAKFGEDMKSEEGKLYKKEYEKYLEYVLLDGGV